jgi:hypothetical protein
MKRIITRGAPLVCASVFLMATGAAAADKPWSLAVTSGMEYDTNVSVQQTDTATGVGDGAADLGLSAGYKLIDKTDGPQLAAGYDFSQNLHFKQKAFDMQTHGLSLNGSTPVGMASVGAGYDFYHLLLGGRSFLDMHMLNPSVSGFVAPGVYARASYIYFSKQFASLYANRNADTHQVGGTLYYFFMKSKAFVSGGAHYENEHTVDPQLRYGSYAANANLQLPITLENHPGKFNLAYEYSRWDYSNITTSIGAKRWENRSTVKGTAEARLVGPLSLTGEYNYIDRRSNFAMANYGESVVQGGLKYVF